MYIQSIILNDIVAPIIPAKDNIMNNIESLEQSIADARYHAKHFAAPNMRASDKRYIVDMDSQLDTLKRQSGIGVQLPLWLPIDAYNKTPVYNEYGQQTGWIF